MLGFDVFLSFVFENSLFLFPYIHCFKHRGGMGGFFFEQVWREVCQLPVLQRAALLLNLRDSRDGGVISFLPFLGVASKEELAQLLEMPYEDFQKLWSELPLDDFRIAQMFGITRQQVINLRKTARERLVRRTRRLDAK